MSISTVFHHPASRIASILAVSAMALGLAACDKMKEPTTGQRSADSPEDAAGKLAADGLTRG